ncbi:alpha/beta hydrolase [Mobilicoccus sp.]|uniref:alpha/beta fold hydrolase n=1 Tax=Mobilicoccus sp. TaxID=2034349 RepID=UPI0028B24A03|nr:alpha/beta hydrolase [Mobilicoccus sp.]
MFVEDVGRGPALVFVPGLGADHQMYAPQVAALTEFRRLALDLRGTGRSPSLDGIADADVLAVQADDIADALRSRGIPRAHLVGISYGGPVVETFMLRHRDLIASAVICDSLCDRPPRTLAGHLVMIGAAAQPATLRLLPSRWSAALIRLVYRRRWPEAGELMVRSLATTRQDDMIKQRRVVNAVRLADDLRGCDVPTLCLVGDHSAVAVGMMRRVEEVLANTEFAIIADSFDPSNLCRPEVFTAHVRDWVTRQEQASPTAAA